MDNKKIMGLYRLYKDTYEGTLEVRYEKFPRPLTRGLLKSLVDDGLVAGVTVNESIWGGHRSFHNGSLFGSGGVYYKFKLTDAGRSVIESFIAADLVV